MSSPSAWYPNSFFSFAVAGSHTSMNPSDDAVTRQCPSTVNRAASTAHFFPNLIFPRSSTGAASVSGATGTATFCCPANTSYAVPPCTIPWCCCHCRAWPIMAMSRDGGTSDTSAARASASRARRCSFDASGKREAGSLTWVTSRRSRREKRSGEPARIADITLVCRSRDRAVSTSPIWAISSTICSYRSSSFARGSRRSFTVASTPSHFPWWMSETKPSRLSTTFRATPVSSSIAANAFCSPFSRRNWSTTFTTSVASTWSAVLWTAPAPPPAPPILGPVPADVPADVPPGPPPPAGPTRPRFHQLLARTVPGRCLAACVKPPPAGC